MKFNLDIPEILYNAFDDYCDLRTFYKVRIYSKTPMY